MLRCFFSWCSMKHASMKALPKRKGNDAQPPQPRPANCLNESPSRKEGKFFSDFTAISTVKVPQ